MFMKFIMNGMPLDLVPHLYLLFSYCELINTVFWMSVVGAASASLTLGHEIWCERYASFV